MADNTCKSCTKCGELKPLDEFSPHPRGKFGRQPSCKACARAYREANREKTRESQRKYYLANKDKIAARSRANTERDAERRREYYQANREEIRNKQADRRKADPESHKARDAAYRAASREKIRAYRIRYAEENRERARRLSTEWQKANHERVIENQRRQRARKRGAAVGEVDLDSLWTGNCGICGQSMDASLRRPDPMSKSIDHITPLSRGGAHEQSNLQWAHLVCNFRKGASLPDVA